MDELGNSTIGLLIDEWIHSSRDRELMRSRLIDGMTYERLAEEYELSVSQVRRINKQCIDKMIKHIG